MREVSAEFPYCGVPPLPGELVSRWNLDPYVWSAMRVSAARHERIAFGAGWLTLEEKQW